MTKEVRNNLIVLALVLAIMAPGAVILFRKKLEPNSRRMFMPDPVVSSTAWCDPIPPESLKRVIPAKSAAWLTAETKQLYNIHAPAGWSATDRPEPIMSHRRWFQLVSAEANTVRIVIWDDRATAENLRSDNGQPIKTDNIPIPKDIRHDLQDIGFVLPPEHVLFAELRLNPGTHTLTLHWQPPNQSTTWNGGTDTLELPPPTPATQP